MIRLSILNENTVYKRGFLGEHGLSVLVETPSHMLLFDTGQTDVFLRNAERMEKDLTEAEAVILSHGHYDHCGGLESMFGKIEMPVYLRGGALSHKCVRDMGKALYRDISIPWREHPPKNLIFVEETLTELFTDIYLLGGIGSYTAEEKPKGFFIEHEGFYRQDLMEDEQMLILRQSTGLIVLAGCCHPGVLNCIAHVNKHFGNEHIHAVVAGMHLMHASKDYIAYVGEELKSRDIDLFYPMHCTGREAIVYLRQILGKRCGSAAVGECICIS